MARKKFEKLDYKTIQKINLSTVEIIRYKGKGRYQNTPNIVLPLITLKRFMDLREEHKIKEIRTSEEYELEDENLLQYLNETGLVDKRFRVFDEKEAWYDVEWEDILRFEENKDGAEIEIYLGHKDDEDYEHRLTIKTNAKTQTEFMFQVIESFDNDIIKEMLEEYEFQKTFNKVLPAEYQREALETFKDVKYYLEYASEDVFGAAYTNLLQHFIEKGHKEFFTPVNLAETIIRMTDLKNIEENRCCNIADLAGGNATFLSTFSKELCRVKKTEQKKINKHLRFITQEKEKTAEILGKLNLSFHGIENHISYHANTILNWEHDENGGNAIGIWEKNVDYIFMNPPLGISDYSINYAISNEQYENRWEYGVPRKQDAEFAFLLSAINLLNDKGKAAIVMPISSLSKESSKFIRQRLIEEGLVESIVNMPPNMLENKISVCIWFINKDKKLFHQNKGIYMMNASKCFEKQNKVNIFKDEAAIKIFQNKETKKNFSGFIKLKDITENDYDISVDRYLGNESDLTLKAQITEFESIFIKENNSQTLYDFYIELKNTFKDKHGEIRIENYFEKLIFNSNNSHFKNICKEVFDSRQLHILSILRLQPYKLILENTFSNNNRGLGKRTQERMKLVKIPNIKAEDWIYCHDFNKIDDYLKTIESSVDTEELIEFLKVKFAFKTIKEPRFTINLKKEIKSNKDDLDFDLIFDLIEKDSEKINQFLLSLPVFLRESFLFVLNKSNIFERSQFLFLFLEGYFSYMSSFTHNEEYQYNKLKEQRRISNGLTFGFWAEPLKKEDYFNKKFIDFVSKIHSERNTLKGHGCFLIYEENELEGAEDILMTHIEVVTRENNKIKHDYQNLPIFNNFQKKGLIFFNEEKRTMFTLKRINIDENKIDFYNFSNPHNMKFEIKLIEKNKNLFNQELSNRIQKELKRKIEKDMNLLIKEHFKEKNSKKFGFFNENNNELLFEIKLIENETNPFTFYLNADITITKHNEELKNNIIKLNYPESNKNTKKLIFNIKEQIEIYNDKKSKICAFSFLIEKLKIIEKEVKKHNLDF